MGWTYSFNSHRYLESWKDKDAITEIARFQFSQIDPIPSLILLGIICSKFHYIGSLESFKALWSYSVKFRFILIGSHKSIVPVVHLLYTIQFHLIGSLESWAIMVRYGMVTLVSIPHVVVQNPDKFISIFVSGFMFQFLIGSLESEVATTGPCPRASFNSSQVVQNLFHNFFR